ncbi:hypothetical protein LP414_27380 [Polaromonas sp. P1(28)-13]|nr:hypothetical protein LP414_27380 [Polaromonas sp. P1(28)-13]
MATISVNGRNYAGSNITIRNGVITIDGVKQADDSTKGAVEIRVLEGTIGELNSDLSVNCNNVTGNVHAGGSVNCDDVGSNVSAGGSVNCDDIGGNVSAGGSVRHG